MLRLFNVGINHEGKRIVSDVSLKINPGQIQVLMGPNGSGKSTLSLALAGHPHYQLNVNSRIILDGTDITELSPEERAKSGLFLSFQSPVAIPGISVEQMAKVMTDNLYETKMSVGTLLKKIEEYAVLVGLKPELLKRSVHDGFSGGEKKRLEMLLLLLAAPKYAILDEIDSGLDIDAIKMITKAIEYAQEKFATGFLIVTHYKRILEYLKVDGVHVLVKGRLALSGGKEIIEQIEERGYQGLT